MFEEGAFDHGRNKTLLYRMQLDYMVPTRYNSIVS